MFCRSGSRMFQMPDASPFDQGDAYRLLDGHTALPGALCQLDEPFHRPAAQFLLIHAYGGEPRREDLAEGKIIHSYQGDVFWDPAARLQKGSAGCKGQDVVHCEHGGGKAFPGGKKPSELPGGFFKSGGDGKNIARLKGYALSGKRDGLRQTLLTVQGVLERERGGDEAYIPVTVRLSSATIGP